MTIIRLPFPPASALPLLAALALGPLTPGALRAAPEPADASPHDVVWDSHGTGEADNMPLGNGRAGANVWITPDGALELYLSHNDAYSELSRLLKLGKIRITFDDTPFGPDKPVLQRFVVRGARIEITAGVPGKTLSLRLWMDARSDVLHIAGESDIPRGVTVTLDNWRAERRVLSNPELASTWNYRTGVPAGTDIHESADVINPSANGLLWYHRNAYSLFPVHFKNQGLTPLANRTKDPLVNRTSGAFLSGEGLKTVDKTTLKSASPRKTFDIRAALLVAQTGSAGEWETKVKQVASAGISAADSLAATSRRWEEEWNRSWIFVEGAGGAPSPVPRAENPLRLGADRNGGSRFAGKFAGVVAVPEAFSPEKIAALAAAAPDKESDEVPSGWKRNPEGIAGLDAGAANALVAGEFTLAAWIRPDSPGGRIFDKITPGGSDGLLFDTHGGLRLILGDKTLVAPCDWKSGVWRHVAATVAPDRGEAVMYLDGKPAGSLRFSKESEAETVTRSYVLSKILNLMQTDGETPAHFQGGIFTVDPKLAYYATDPKTFAHTPDYRFYGVSYWWQNVRFLYLPLLAQGDYAPVRKFIDFYASKSDLFKARAKTYYGAEGVYFQETVNLTGLPGMGDFGWGAKEYSESYTRNIWQQALELTTLMQDYYDATGDKAFLDKTLVPWATASLKFYDTRFPKKDGLIRITPTHAVETYWTGVVNDMPSVAGLRAVTDRLLKLPESSVSASDRTYWKTFATRIPPLPKRRLPTGETVPDNAEAYDPARSNYESPDLYGAFPFRVYGLLRDKEPVGEAREAWKRMPNPGHACWYQTGVIAARLGLADGAKQDVVLRAKNRMARSDKPGAFFRFPGYLGSPHDWCPDFDGPGNMMNTLQEMILQPGPDGEILLTPAWPKTWNAKFKLYAPGGAVIQGVIKDGKLADWTITPESARGRVRILGPAS